MFRPFVVTLSLLLFLLRHSDAFASLEQRRGSVSSLSVLRMLNGNAPTPTLPRDVKEAVSKCRAAVQDALKARLSRMDIEMPVGTKFGVERTPKKKGRVVSDDKDSGHPTLDLLQASDRELARLFVEMFQPLGGNHISVVFNDADLADVAKAKWQGDPSASSRILSMNRRRTKKAESMKNKKKSMGFASKLAAEVEDKGIGENSAAFKLPDGTEVALFVAPGPKELIVIDKICTDVGMGTLVVLLNARLSRIENFGTEKAKSLFLEEFEPVFHLRAAPQQDAPGCLLHRSYPSDWLLGRKPKVGPAKVLLSQKTCPTIEQCREAYQNTEVSDLEKGVESLLGGVAGWFQ